MTNPTPEDVDRVHREAVADDRKNYESERDTDRAAAKIVREVGANIDRRSRR